MQHLREELEAERQAHEGHLESQRELEISRERYASLYDLAPVGYLTLDGNGVIHEINLAGASLLGMKRTAILGRPLRVFAAKADQRAVLRHLTAMRRGELSTTTELTLAGNDPAPRVVELRTVRAHVDPTSARGYRCLATLTDITARKQAEEAVRTSEERLRRLYAAMNDGLVLHEVVYNASGQAADYRLLDVNPAFERITGIPRERAVGALASALYGNGAPPFLEIYARVAASGEAQSFETDFTPMGKCFHVSVFSPGQGRFATVFADITERKQAQEAVRASEELNRRTLQAMPAHIAVLDRQGRILAANQAWEEFGAQNRAAGEPSATVGANYLEVCRRATATPDASAADALAGIEAVIAGRQAQFTMEYPCHSPQEQRWFHMTAVPLGAPGEGGAVITHLNITARKQAEQALQKAHAELEKRVAERTAQLARTTELAQAERQRFYAVLETLPAYVCLLTPDYRMPFANRIFREWFGYRPDRKCYEFLFDRSQPCERCETYNVLKTGGPQRWEWSGPNGRHYDVFDFPFTDTDGSSLILEMGVDITERKQAEAELDNLNATLEQHVAQRTAELRQSREDLDRAQTVGQIGWWRLDTRTNALTWSDENYRIFGVPAGTPLTYETFLGFVHPEDRAQLDAHWQAALRGEPYDLEHRVLTDGQVKWVREKAYLEFDSEGQLLGGFGIAQDITRRKEAEAQILASLAEKSVLLAEIHHRVKNNLQVISSLINLQADTLQEPAVRASLVELRDRVRTMALVHEKLYESQDFARMNFADYAASLLGYLWRAHSPVGTQVRLIQAAEPLGLPLDLAVPCGLILNELAINTLKHAFKGRSDGEVRFSLSQNSATGRIAMAVSDNGVGLPAGFDWRTADTLGLRLVRVLAQQIHGDVEAGPGPGTQFRIAFPIPPAS